jgi:hypothetical protein
MGGRIAGKGPAGRLRGALALEPAAYRAVADDPAALGPALLIVLGATLLAGLGGYLWTQWGGRFPENAIFVVDAPRFLVRSVLIGGALQVTLWAGWVAVAWLYLAAFGERAAVLRLARAMGYAAAPLAIQLFICPPGLELAAAAVAFGYTFAAMTVAVQAAAATSPGRAAVSALAGFVLFAVALSLLGNGTRDLAPGIFALDPLSTSVGFTPR